MIINKIYFLIFFTLVFSACRNKTTVVNSVKVVENSEPYDLTLSEEDVENASDTTLIQEGNKIALKWCHKKIANDTFRTTNGNKATNYKLELKIFENEQLVGTKELVKQDFSKKIGSHVSIHNTSFQGYSKKKHEFIFHTLVCEPETDNSIIFEFSVDKTGHFRNIKDIEVSEGDDD